MHKILTGRHAGFDSVRQQGGLSGYPSRAESPHDWIENSHASTALAYADGIDKAFQLTGELPHRRVVAAIGDGALTGRLAWEGLNNLAAATKRPVIIVLNDNGRSYDPTVGGLADHLAGLRGRYRCKGTALPEGAPVNGRTLFDQLGLTYIGPIDGHDPVELERGLRHAATLDRPVVVHAVTEKGRGWQPAVADTADRMHGIGVLNPATGRSDTPATQSWTSVFGDEITRIGGQRSDVVCLTGAMLQPVGLKQFADAFPSRVFDSGIAEQHAVCSAAGLSMGGLHPVVCVYATFLNRAFDQVLMDVALHRRPVTFVLDRAGITGPDGASHHGMWDISILAVVPGLRVAAPRDPARLRELLGEAINDGHGPTVVRFPKATTGPDIPVVARMDGLDILHRSPHLPLDVLIVTAGTTAGAGLDAARDLTGRGIGVTIVDPRWILPVHPTLTHLAARHRLVVTVEDGSRTGGFGAATLQACADKGINTPVRVLGLPREFIAAADRVDLLAAHGLTGQAITDTVLTSLTNTQ